MSLCWLTIAQIERGVTRLNFPVFGRLPCRYHPSRQIGHCPSEPRWQPNGSVWPAACMHKTKRWYFRKTYKLNLYKPFWLQLRDQAAITGANKGLADLQGGERGWVSGRVILAARGWQAMPSPQPSPTGRGSNTSQLMTTAPLTPPLSHRAREQHRQDGGQ